MRFLAAQRESGSLLRRHDFFSAGKERTPRSINGGRPCSLRRCGRSRAGEIRASGGSQPVVNSVKARWTIEASFGRKGEALNLMKDWVLNVASKGGLDSKSVTLCSGAVGAPESRIELEIGFPDVGAWEAFLSRIPAEGHRKWSKEMEPCIIDGSPTWSVFYLTDISAAVSDGEGGDDLTLSSDLSSSGLVIPQMETVQRLTSAEDFTSLLEGALSESTEKPTNDQNLEESLTNPTNVGKDESDEETNENSAIEEMRKNAPPGSRVVLDWKGDPMIVKPGDSMPFV
ncbi:hypothetical protein BSKO_13426 [Bryopsis sp. KO-2023]|nr:hypothetical protein BSKO_13426 [Bryopsis sp. KO-2023]